MKLHKQIKKLMKREKLPPASKLHNMIREAKLRLTVCEAVRLIMDNASKGLAMTKIMPHLDADQEAFFLQSLRDYGYKANKVTTGGYLVCPSDAAKLIAMNTREKPKKPGK